MVNGVFVVYLWGEISSVYGIFVKFLKGFKGLIKFNGDEFKVVVIKGSINYI